MIEGRDSNWGERTVLTAGHHDRSAGAAPHELPGVTLEIGSRGALAGCTRAGSAVILTLQGDAVAFFLARSRRRVSFRFRKWSGGRHGRKRRCNGRGENRRANGGLRHAILPLVKRATTLGRTSSKEFAQRRRSVTV